MCQRVLNHFNSSVNITEQTLSGSVCCHMHVCVCDSLPQCNICLCSNCDTAPQALQTEAQFFISAKFCLLFSKPTLPLSLLLPRLPVEVRQRHMYTRTCSLALSSLCVNTHMQTNETDCLWSLTKLFKMSTGSSRAPTCAHSSDFTRSRFSQRGFAYFSWCCLLFMSQIVRCDPLAVFILSLLKETLILLFLQQMGAGFLISVKMIKLLKQTVSKPSELAVQDEYVLIIIP